MFYWFLGARLKLNKANNKKHQTVGTAPKSNQNFIETGKIDTPNTHTCDRVAMLQLEIFYRLI